MNGTSGVEEYRRTRRGRAATGLSLIVSLVTVLGGYQVMDALNVDAPSHPSSILPVTREVVRESIGGVLDERLSDERLKAMLGVGDAARTQKTRQNALAGVAAEAGQPVESPPPGPDYALKYYKTRSADLADELTNGIDASAVNRLTPCDVTPQQERTIRGRDQKQGTRVRCYVAGDRESELRAVRDVAGAGVQTSLTVPGHGSPTPVERVRRWAEEVVTDAGVDRVWRDGRYSENAADFLVRALDPPTLPDAIGKRVAAAVSLHTIDATAVAPAARGLASRLTWGVTAILFIGLWVAAILVAGWQLWTLLPSGRAQWTLGVGAALALLAGVYAYAFTTRGPETFALLGPLLRRLERESGTEIVGLARVFGAMTTSAIVLLLLAASATTWNAAKDTVEAHLEGIRTIFNVSAALLVAQSIQIAALYSWPAAALEDAQDTTGPLGATALLMAGLAGAVFSVALMIVYLPAVSVLRGLARENDSLAAEALLQRQGVRDSGMQWILRLLQALSPLLAAVPISGLLALLAE